MRKVEFEQKISLTPLSSLLLFSRDGKIVRRSPFGEIQKLFDRCPHLQFSAKSILFSSHFSFPSESFKNLDVIYAIKGKMAKHAKIL